MSKHKFIVGLTGNIATGKSTIMQLAAERGAHTVDADKVAHEVLANNTAVKDAIRAAFGESVFDAEGMIIRPNLGRIVFSNPTALQQLESITHPAIRQTILAQINATDAKIVFVEAIKLLEGPLKAASNQIWVTFCSTYIQIERLINHRDMVRADAEQRVAAQSPTEDKIAQADVVIDTNGAMTATVAQFEGAWNELMKVAG